MHYHIRWSKSGFHSDRFNSYADGLEIAYDLVAMRRKTRLRSEGLMLVPRDETYSVEMFDEVCPVCARNSGDR